MSVGRASQKELPSSSAEQGLTKIDDQRDDVDIAAAVSVLEQFQSCHQDQKRRACGQAH